MWVMIPWEEKPLTLMLVYRKGVRRLQECFMLTVCVVSQNLSSESE